MVTVIDSSLLDAGARILDNVGVGGMSISAVAAEAGVSRVTLHRNDVTVEELTSALVERAGADLRNSLWPAMNLPEDAATRLGRAARVLCEVAERHSGVLSALYHQPTRPHPTRAGRTTSYDFVEPFERLLLDGNSDGTLSSPVPADDAELLVNAITWTYLHMRRSHGWPTEQATDRTTALCLGLLR